MSKKHTFGTIIAICIVAAIAITLVFQNKNNIAQKAAAPAEALSAQLERACQIFPEDKARTLLGSQAVKSDSSNATSSSEDIAVSECSYSDGLSAAAAVDSQQRASLVVRTSRTTNGSQANKTVFASNALPGGAKAVTGYGDAAFWNPEFGQLNILKDEQWYILEYGSLVPTKRNETDTKKFADLIIDSL